MILGIVNRMRCPPDYHETSYITFFLPSADAPFIPVHRTGFSGANLIKTGSGLNRKQERRKTPIGNGWDLTRLLLAVAARHRLTVFTGDKDFVSLSAHPPTVPHETAVEE
jgi:hypothetical protein